VHNAAVKGVDGSIRSNRIIGRRVNMGSSSKKCPLCNRKLVDVNGIPTCPDCGYRDPKLAKAASEASYGGTSSQSAGYQDPYARAAGESAESYYGQGAQRSQGYGSNIPKEPVKNKKSKKKENTAGRIVGSVCLICAIGVAVTLFRTWLRGTLENAFDSFGNKEASSELASSDTVEGGSASEDEPSGGKVEAYNIPKSEFLVALVEGLFGKPVIQVTYEELCSIDYLDIYESEDVDGRMVDVGFADGTSVSYITDYSSIDTADFACLEGLCYLYIEDETMDFGTNWHNLKNLQYLSCDVSMEALMDYMDVSQLVYLKSGDTFGMDDLSIVFQYTGLEYLELDVGLMTSLEGISKGVSLKGLAITDADRVTDFSELYDMPWLEALSIESQGLKDIGFISGMDNLKSLSLEGTELKRIEAISDCADTLTELSLDENYYIEDLSPVFQCTGLERLRLWADYQFDVPMEVPDFSAMTKLYSLSISNYDKYTNLPLLTGLTELTIEDASAGAGGVLRSLTNLKTLNLVDMSITSGEWIEDIATLENLEALNLEDSYIWADISPLFGMQSLQSLDLKDVHCGLETGKLTANEKLIYLNLEGTGFAYLLEDGSWDYNGDDTEIPMQEALDALAPCMPGLRQLCAPDHELDSLEFAAGLSDLQWLDVSNNYITDLAPLQGLSQLTVLICEDNPVRSTDGLEKVFIYQ